MGEVGQAYAGCRARVTALVESLDERQAAVTVPACPEWSVHDVVAHLAGVVDDALAGRLDGVATEPWTHAQVDARRDIPVAAIAAEWNAQAPAFEDLLDVIGDPGRQAVADAVTHEHDIRHALGRPGDRDSDAVRVGLSFVLPLVVGAMANKGVRLRVETPDLEVLGGGDGDPDTVLRGDRFDLLRAMTGRRSVEQLRGLIAQGDRDDIADLFTFGPFRPAATTIDE